MRYVSMAELLASIGPETKRLSLDALSEPQRTDTALHLAHNLALRQAAQEGHSDVLPARTTKNQSTTLPAGLWRSERDFQAACFERFAQLALTRPEYGMIFAIPNGQYRQGQRMEPGLKAGMPDIMVPIPRQFTDEHGDSYCLGGLFLELKIGKGKPSALQIETMCRLMLAGYRCCVVWDEVDRAVATIEEYLRS